MKKLCAYMVWAALILSVFGCEAREEVLVASREAARWHHPASPADAIGAAGQSMGSPAAAISDNGEAMVVWTRFDGTSWQLAARAYRDRKWQDEQLLGSGPGKMQQPRIAMAANGDAVIVWEQADKDRNCIMLAERRNGVWKVPQAATEHISVGEKFAWEPDVALNDAGDTVIAWSQEAESGLHGIYKSEYRSGTWHHPRDLADRISPSPGNDALRPRVAINNSGAALIVWEQDIDGVSKIFTSEFRNNRWNHPVAADDSVSPKSEGNRGAYMPLVAMDDAGNALIAWKQAHENRERIYLSAYQNGTWHHPQSLAEAISPPEIIAATLNDLDLDNKGNALILWTAFAERQQSLYRAEFRQGQWHHPAAGETFVAATGQWEFNIIGNGAMAGSGKAVVAWLQRGDNRKIEAYLVEYDNGAWNLPGKLLNVGEQPAIGFAVSASPRENFIVAWQQRNEEGATVFASLFLVAR